MSHNHNKWLVDVRGKQSLTHEKIAEQAGIHRSYYTKIENGAIPSVKVAKRIASILGIDWTLFYTGEGHSPAINENLSKAMKHSEGEQK